MKTEFKNSISIIIPYRNDFYSLRKLLLELSRDVYTYCEIIIVDSSNKVEFFSEKLLKEFGNSDIKVIRKGDCFPGNARNIGARNTSSEVICFLDSKTMPSKDWLQNGLRVLNKKNVDLVIGCFKSVEASWFGKIVKASTFGNISHFCLPGTIIRRSKFLESGGFNPAVRAGEDIDWFNRISQLGYKIYRPNKTNLDYTGLPQSLTKVIKKWYLYSMENAKVNILITQKSIYFFLLLFFILYIAYRWNYIFTGGDWDSSPYFIPHLNTILWSFLGCSYLLFRSVFIPLIRKEKLSFLFPINFIFIGLLSLLIDLVKIPGRLYGFWQIISYNHKI
ncbi:glycosyltransferase [Gammaproteobacteria bacterium]|nr:glycosyltransferase [Gammaproteobacteria bacterium]MDA8798900.1 glycosyltransferase [Gammaproteobacteria bacterium]MDC0919405.1 glycosyltransferase [Gammaproteobacteria bacterium]